MEGHLNPTIEQQQLPPQIQLPEQPFPHTEDVKPLSVTKTPVSRTTHQLQSSGSVSRKPVGRKAATATQPATPSTNDNGTTQGQQELESSQAPEVQASPQPSDHYAPEDSQTQLKDATSSVVELPANISRRDSSDFMPMMDISAPPDIGFNHQASSLGVSREPPASNAAWDDTPVSTFDPTRPKRTLSQDASDNSSSARNFHELPQPDAVLQSMNHITASQGDMPLVSSDKQQMPYESGLTYDQFPEVVHHDQHNHKDASVTKIPVEPLDVKSATPSPARVLFGWDWYMNSFGDPFFVNQRRGMVTRQAPLPEPIPGGESIGPLPAGWEMKTLGTRKVFVNNHFVRQTWKDPRLSAHFAEHTLPEGWGWDVTEQGRVYYIDYINKSTTFNHPKGEQTILDPERLGPIPLGWEIGKTAEGRKFFTNTNAEDERTWKDPRVSAYFKMNPLPSHWDWDVTENGRIFFLDHSNGQTTFDDPRAHVLVRKPLVLPIGWGMTVDDQGELSFHHSVTGNVARLPPFPQDLLPEQIPFLDMSNKSATIPVPQPRTVSRAETSPSNYPPQAMRSHSAISKASIDSKQSSGGDTSSAALLRQNIDSPAQSITSGRLPSPTNPYEGIAFNAQPQAHAGASPSQSVSSQQQMYPQYPSMASQAGPYINNTSSITATQSPPLGKAPSNNPPSTTASPFHTLCCHCQQGIPYNYAYQRCTFCDLNICTGCTARHPRHQSSRCVLEVRTWEPQFPGRWCGMCRMQGPTRLDCRSCQFSICDSCFIQHKGKIVHKHENSCLSRYLNPSLPKSGINMNGIGRDGTVHGHCCTNETVSHCPRCLKPESTSVRVCLDCPHSNYGYCSDCSEWLSAQENGCNGHRFIDISYQKVLPSEFNELVRGGIIRCVTCEQSLPCGSFPSTEASATMRGHLEENPEHRRYSAFVTSGMLQDICAKSYMGCLRKAVRPDEPPSQNQTATFDCVRCRNGTKLKNLVSCVPCIRDPHGIRVCRQCFPFVAPTHEHSATEFICEADKVVPHDMLKIGWSAKQNQTGRLWYSYTDPYTGNKSMPTFNQQEALRGPNDPIPQQQTHTRVSGQSFQAESKQAWNDGKAGVKQLWSKVKQPSPNQPRPVGQTQGRPQSQVYGAPQSLPTSQPTNPPAMTQSPVSSAQQQTTTLSSQQYPPAPDVNLTYSSVPPHATPQQSYQTTTLATQGQPQSDTYTQGQYPAGGPMQAQPPQTNSYTGPGQATQPLQPVQLANTQPNNAYTSSPGAYAAPQASSQYPSTQAQYGQPSKFSSGIGDVKSGMKDLWKKVPINTNSQQQQQVGHAQANGPPTSPQYGSQPPNLHNRRVSAGPGIPQQNPQGNAAQGRPQAPRAKSSKTNKNKLMMGGAGVGGAALAMKFGMKALRIGLSGGEDFGDDGDDFGGGDYDDGGDVDTGDGGGGEDYGAYGGDDQTAVNDIGTDQDANLAYDAQVARGQANAVALI